MRDGKMHVLTKNMEVQYHNGRKFQYRKGMIVYHLNKDIFHVGDRLDWFHLPDGCYEKMDDYLLTQE